MEAPTPTPETPARTLPRTKYGRSCINCSKAKCKCSYLPGHPICERCDRLNKQCKPLVSVRRGEVPPAASSSSTNDTQINDKLDELISLLKARKGISVPQTPISDVSETKVDSSLPLHLRLDPTSLAEMTDDATAPNPGASNSQQYIPVGKLPVSPEQATRCFDRFKKVMLHSFPIMYIPDSMSVTELEQTYPTLHLCVLVTAATSTSQLFLWSEQLRQTVVKKMFDAGERSLDLLLAILTFIGWVRHHRQERPFFNLWLQMAISLVSDLGLDKRAQGDTTWWPWHRDSIDNEQSIIEKRVVLAVYVLSSISASSIRSVDSLQWTSHMDTCLLTLEQYPEWNGDTILSILTRCCLITEGLYRAGQPVWPFISALQTSHPSSSAHHSLEVILSFEGQIEEVKHRARATGVDGVSIISMSIMMTELDIHEAVANPEKPFSDSGLSVTEELARYHSQLTCLKSWWEAFLAIEPDHLPDASFIVLTQLIHGTVSLFRLTMLQHPRWDRQMVKNTASITDYMATFADVTEALHQRVGLICDRGDDINLKTAKTMRKLRQFFLNMLALEESVSAGVEPPLNFSENIPDMMDLDFWGSQWLTDMIVGWEK